jgi:hypothetical protein
MDVIGCEWATDYRGPVQIHAAKRLSGFVFEHATILFASLGIKRANWPSPESLLRGGIVGEAELVDCVAPDAGHSSPWNFGPYGLVLRNVRAVPFRAGRDLVGLFENV